MGALFMLIFFLFAISVLYPLSAIVLYRLAGSKKSIKQIMKEI